MPMPIADSDHTTIRVLFPQGKRKALVLSYDDGSEHDRRLVALLNEYGLRATFHLNSGVLDSVHHIASRELPTLYRGHEVAAHGVNHLDLTTLSNEAIDREVGDDQKALEDRVGAPVRGFAYPFGAHDERTIERLSALGLAYGRTIHTTAGFGLPERPLALGTSCHHNQALALGQRFLEQDGEQPALFYVWGHSYELDGFMSADPRKDWRYLEDFCRLMHVRPEIYYATTLDVLDYLTAVKALGGWSMTGPVHNDSKRTIWLSCGGQWVELAAGETFGRSDET
ncbi:MAG: polysaccharide deacetylase family protein [Gammaproteobacteria bacterium]